MEPIFSIAFSSGGARGPVSKGPIQRISHFAIHRFNHWIHPCFLKLCLYFRFSSFASSHYNMRIFKTECYIRVYDSRPFPRLFLFSKSHSAIFASFLASLNFLIYLFLILPWTEESPIGIGLYAGIAESPIGIGIYGQLGNRLGKDGKKKRPLKTAGHPAQKATKIPRYNWRQMADGRRSPHHSPQEAVN